MSPAMAKQARSTCSNRCAKTQTKAGCRVADVRVRVMDNRFFNECIALDDASKLKAILRAVPKWEEVAVAEAHATESADTSQMTSKQQHWHGEYVNDQFYMIDATKNGLLAVLSVARRLDRRELHGDALCGE